MSRPTESKAKTSYPLYAAAFASNRPGVLVVGGGGGAGRHGVKNKISVFDFTSRAPNVEPLAEIEASQDDSVTSLAALGAKDGMIVFAGINSGEEDRLKGKNEHLKSYEVKLPTKSKNTKDNATPQGSIEFLSKSNLFKPPTTDAAKQEGYQRIIRLSPPSRTATKSPNKRIGAIASGLAGDENEIVIFSATSNRPDNPKDIISRIALHKGQEANDVDIFDLGGGKFLVAYCTDYDVSFQSIQYDFDKKKVLGTPSTKKAYAVSVPDGPEKKGRSKIRCLRWLSPSHILLLVNKPSRTGVELWVLRLYEEGPGSIIQRRKLGKHAKAAVDMDVALLDEDAKGRYQVVVAVAAIDVSLTVLTINYHGTDSNSLSSFSSFATYYNVHDLQMTKVIFSPFLRPEGTPGKSPAYLRLASTSLGNSIDVETFQLQPLAKDPRSRHVLQSAGRKAATETAKYLLIAMIVAAVALMLQGFVDPEGNLTRSWVPASLQNAARDIVPPGVAIHVAREEGRLGEKSRMAKTGQRLAEILHLHQAHPTEPTVAQKAVVIHHDPETDGKLSTEVHDDHEDVVKKHTEAKKWEELSHSEQKKWKERLVYAGVWAVEEGETILKSIFFSEVGGVIGGVAQGVLG